MRLPITKALLLIALASTLGACTLMDKTNGESAKKEAKAPPPPVVVPPPKPAVEKQAVPEKPQPEPAPPPPPPKTTYKVDPKTSLLEILVYRAGKLAHLGDNHILASRQLRGTIKLPKDLKGASLDLSLPAEKLIVDDPELRKKAGEEFAKQPDEQTIADTRERWLGAKMLDVKNHPRIRIQGKLVGKALPDLQLDGTATMHGKKRAIKAPVKVEKQKDKVVVKGEFQVSLKNFGLEPISMLAGALTVKDQITLRFHAVGRIGAPPAKKDKGTQDEVAAKDKAAPKKAPAQDKGASPPNSK